MIRLRHKGSKDEEEEQLSLVELAACMIFQLSKWLPNRRFRGGRSRWSGGACRPGL
jgi:hypothetical protein